ncbi:SRPBCC domain-containing protein [Paracoccus sp. PXZ]
MAPFSSPTRWQAGCRHTAFSAPSTSWRRGWGGYHRMSFRNFTTGHSHSFGGTYLELVPDKRLVYTDRFDDPNLPGEMTVTVELKPVSVGTEVTIEQQGVPDVIPTEACYLGWQDSLRKLAKLVEPEINQ